MGVTLIDKQDRTRSARRACVILSAAAGAASVAVGAMAQERIVVDLPLPPPATVSDSGGGERGGTRIPAMARLNAEPEPVPAARPEPEPRREAATAQPANEDTREVRAAVRPGESLYVLFRRHALSQADLVAMQRADRTLRAHLRRLQPGQRLTVTSTAEGSVIRLVLSQSGPRDLVVERGDEGRFTWRRIADADVAAHETPPPARPVASDAVSQAPVSGASAGTPEAQAPAPRSGSVRSVTVRRGDSLFLIFRRLDVPASDLALLLDSNEHAATLRRLQPGQTLEIGQSPDGHLVSLSAVLDETRTLRAREAGGRFDVTIDHVPLERREQHASAAIENALFLAGQRAGLSDRVIMQLVEIFGWDVDFALDVRAGDRFAVVYEGLYKDGSKVRDGDILAAEFVNRGRTLRAVRYTFEDGRSEYFSPDGLSMRKAFLRTPVNFSRISSRFSRGRMHPVLQRMRAHKGVDYAAPTGTPVKAAGDGRVVFAGRKGGYGKTVILQHGGTYTTLYGHMSRLHRRSRSGNRVQQGQIIGYVGSTGLATGPHLHYEFRVRGVHKDPLRVKLPAALPIDERLRPEFLRVSAPLVATLDTLSRTSLASSD